MTPARERPRLSIEKREQRSRPLALAVVIHILIILALAAITFHYPLGQLMGLRPEEHTPERLQYIVLPGGAPAGNGAQAGSKAPPPKGAPAPLLAPRQIPAAVPPVPPPHATSGAVSGKAGGSGGAPAGAATGVEPALPDPRLTLSPYPLQTEALTPAQRTDSAVKAAFGVYIDSERVAALRAGRAPGDWTVTRGGQKWGWDPAGIRLGKFTIPNALLAALPLDRIANGESPEAQRNDAWIRRDIMEHAQSALTEDEFRDAVRRIRERKEKERREQQKEKQGGTVADGHDGSGASRP